MTDRKTLLGEIVVVDEEVRGFVVTNDCGRTFHPLTFRVKGSLYYGAGSPVMLKDSNVVRPAVLADGEKFRIHLEAYGLAE